MRSPSRHSVLRKAAAIVLAATFGAIGGGKGSLAGQEPKNLQLEVFINDVPSQIIAGFVLFDRNRIGIAPGELDELGLRIDPRRRSDAVVMLDEIPTLTYDYQERRQTIRITVDDTYRKGQMLDLGSAADRRSIRTEAAWGVVVNYDLLSVSDVDRSFPAFSGNSLTLDARAFSPVGTFQQSAILRTLPQRPAEAIRLDTSFRSSDQDRLISYSAGDTISGGLAWTRPIRIGGLQAQSNFALRPDLITMPLPSLGGSAAVPSTVDVYVNNTKTFSQEVAAGPFSISNVPLVSGAGNAELVVRDAAGHQTRTSLPFYASSSLLAPGLMAWSLEAGLPRLSYGSGSDAYVGSPIGAATLRRGIFDWITVEGHVEAGAAVTNGGVGAVVRTGHAGVASAALAGSTGHRESGLQTYFAYETQLFGLNISASSQHTFGRYDDLASSTARLLAAPPTRVQDIFGVFNYLSPAYLASSAAFGPAASSSIFSSARPPLSLNRMTLGAPLPFDDKSNVSSSLIDLVESSGRSSRIVTGTYTRALPFSASLFATVFHDFGTGRNTGLFAGFNVPISPSTSVSTGVSRGPGGLAGSVDVVKSAGNEPGSYGWRIHDAEGVAANRQASMSYRSNYGTVQAGVSQIGRSSSGALELRGSITTMDGGVFLSNWIDDGFAVVNVGVPDVEVLHENRSAGLTDSRGMLLLPALRAYQRNKIAIDPANLPVDAEIETTHEIVAPADRAGALVKFNVRSSTSSALVSFVRSDGSYVPAGATGRMDGGGEFVVGYDGQAFIGNLASINQVSIDMIEGTCHAAFAFAAKLGEQIRIAPVPCR